MEVCVDCVQSAKNAEEGGASRIELCANLVEGGTTPSIGMLQAIKEAVKIPVFVMIRPRGGDFCYDELELNVMTKDIHMLKAAGADGFVFGILNTCGAVNVDACQALLDECHPFPVTFHRAIDMTEDIHKSVQQVVQLGFQRVLTSGGHSTAIEGKQVIGHLIKQHGHEIIIVPGGGINASNLNDLLDCGVKEFHGTAREILDSKMAYRKQGLLMGTISGAEFITKQTSVNIVKELVTIANSRWTFSK